MKKLAFIAPMFVLGFLTYWGVTWFCADWGISNAPIRTLVGIMPSESQPFALWQSWATSPFPVTCLSTFDF